VHTVPSDEKKYLRPSTTNPTLLKSAKDYLNILLYFARLADRGVAISILELDQLYAKFPLTLWLKYNSIILYFILTYTQDN
jgi:hypothetical protein